MRGRPGLTALPIPLARLKGGKGGWEGREDGKEKRGKGEEVVKR